MGDPDITETTYPPRRKLRYQMSMWSPLVTLIQAAFFALLTVLLAEILISSWPDINEVKSALSAGIGKSGGMVLLSPILFIGCIFAHLRARRIIVRADERHLPKRKWWAI